MKTLLSTATCLPLLAALSPHASADLITWGPVETATAASDVSTNGTLVTARNPWAQTFVEPTVNGVFFEAYAPTGWTNGGWTLNAGSSTGDPDYDALLDSARVTAFGPASNPNGWGAIRLDTLGTLTVGMQYEIQVWYSDQRTGTATNILFDRRMTLSSATGPAALSQGFVTNLSSLTQGTSSGFLDADPNNMAGAGDTEVGSFCVGTFTRTSTEELYLLMEGSHPVASNNLRPHINAFQIREVSGGSLGSNYCVAANNTTGVPGAMFATGSLIASNDDLTLGATNLPVNQFGIFLASMTQGFNMGTNGTSNGNLCLGGAIGRFNTIRNSGAAGEFTLTVGTQMIPQGGGTVAIMAGQTWNFQAWHREGAGLGSNFTDGLEVMFQ